MISRTITNHPAPVLEYSEDLSSLRRLLVAAAISASFCTRLLKNPGLAVRQGFGGELFPLSDSTQHLVSSIQASTLKEFIQRMNEDLPIL